MGANRKVDLLILNNSKMKEGNKTKETNEVQTIIDLARSHEELDNALSDIAMYLLSIKRGSRNIVGKYDNPNIGFIFKQIDELHALTKIEPKPNISKGDANMIKGYINTLAENIMIGSTIIEIDAGWRSIGGKVCKTNKVTITFDVLK